MEPKYHAARIAGQMLDTAHASAQWSQSNGKGHHPYSAVAALDCACSWCAFLIIDSARQLLANELGNLLEHPLGWNEDYKVAAVIAQARGLLEHLCATHQART